MPTLAELAGYGDDPSTTGGGLLGLLTSFIDNRKRGLLNNVQGGPGLLGARINESARDFNREERSWMGAERSVIPELRDMAGQRTLNQALNMGGLLAAHTVYHGSPHKFDKFDASKIGTGEGAQAYGHGIYVAENPAVAKEYAAMRDSTFRVKWDGGEPINNWGNWFDNTERNLISGAKVVGWDKMVAQTKDPVAKAKAVELSKHVDFAPPVTSGNLYKADLPDEWLPKMLDWDKPLSQQPALARALEDAQWKQMEDAARKAGMDVFEYEKSIMGSRHYPPTPTGTGEEFVKRLASYMGGHAKASQHLSAHGVPGIRYKDGGSRGTEGGTHNYVVFPGMEKYLKILGIE
jgi:hypothetical protein